MNTEEKFIIYIKSQYNQLSANTIRNYKTDCLRFIKWYEGKFKIPITTTPYSISKSSILDLYKKDMLDKNISKNSINRHLSSFKKLFEFLREQGLSSYDKGSEELSTKTEGEFDKSKISRFKDYLSSKNKSYHTIKNYIFDIQRFLIWSQQYLRGGINDRIDYDLLSKYKSYLGTKQLSEKSIKRNLSSIQKYTRWNNSLTDHKSLDIINHPISLPKDEYQSQIKEKLNFINLNSKLNQSLPSIKTPNVKKGEPFAKRVYNRIEESIANLKGVPIFRDTPELNKKFKPRIHLIKININLSQNIAIVHKRHHSASIAPYLIIGVFTFFAAFTALALYNSTSAYNEKSVKTESRIEQLYMRINNAINNRGKITSPISDVDKVHINILSPVIASHK